MKTDEQNKDDLRKTVILLGGSGLVGAHVLNRLLEMDEVKKVKVIGRRSLDQKHLKLEQRLIDFDRLDDFAEEFVGSAVICCLGTTLKQAGSQEAFFHLEFEVVRKIARLSAMRGAAEFFLVSSMGADPESPFFYFKTKGQIEAELMQYPFMKLKVYRPSLLLGKRQDLRVLESAGKVLLSVLSPLFVGPLRRWRPTSADKLAAKICQDLKSDDLGRQIVESSEMRA